MMIFRESSHYQPRARGAFSLLEVIVSCAILALILGFLFALFNSTQSSFIRLNNTIHQRQDARVILANMARELKEAFVAINGGYEGFDPGTRRFQLLINSPAVSAGPEEILPGAHTIFWQTRVNEKDGGSALVGYGIRWDTSRPSSPRPLFCRMAISTSASQKILVQMQEPSSSGVWGNADLLAEYAPGDEAHGYRGWLADNIIAFYVRALDGQNLPIIRAARAVEGLEWTTQRRSRVKFATSVDGPSYLLPGGQPYTYTYDARLGYQWLIPNTKGGVDPRVNVFGPVLPPAVEIIIVVASPQAISRMTAIPAPGATASGDLWDGVAAFIAGLPEALRQDVRTYSTIVSLSARP